MVQATVILLKNTEEYVSIATGQNIVLDMRSHTISQNENQPTLINKGTVEILNGTFLNSSTANHSAVHNENNAHMTLTGVTVNSTGKKQALYNNGGVITVNGNSYFSATSSNRATVDNYAGNLTFLSGTIISENYYALKVEYNVYLGAKDSNYDADSILVKGKTNGVYVGSGKPVPHSGQRG